MKKNRLLLLLLTLLLTVSSCGCGNAAAMEQIFGELMQQGTYSGESFDLASVPEYQGEAYVVLNQNVPDFTEDELTTEPFEMYSPLDSLDRCGVAVANVCREIMPTEERGSIGMVKPSGWHTVKYDVIKDKYLYNRCHLIGYQLSGENANKGNLITGTRYLNMEGMLPFENAVAEYVENTGNHVLYRVTPIFEGDDLVAKGVQMEAMSVEDDGKGIMFHVFCYNVQPGVEINYHDGSSRMIEEESGTPAGEGEIYICNTGTMKYHTPDCSSAIEMKAKNKKVYTGSEQQLEAEGYSPCKNCNP